ncbi:MAG: hypothetical protein LQ346_007465 [Caloplaca aetnensis]|nr:MAG: hypothetical protein LQ346_007465 [Caloplaca aetnensis]
MFDFAPQNFSMSSRRHAIKPEEAEYLTKALANSCVTYTVQPLRQTKSREDHAEANDTRTASAADVAHLTPSKWTTIGPDMVSLTESQAYTISTHHDQPQQPNAGTTAADDWWSSSRSSFHSRHDNKRKLAALSDDDVDLSPSTTAVDIVHPSELKFEGNVATYGLETPRRSPTQVNQF